MELLFREDFTHAHAPPTREGHEMAGFTVQLAVRIKESFWVEFGGFGPHFSIVMERVDVDKYLSALWNIVTSCN